DYVTALDGYFKNVREKDVIFSFEKCHLILDEMICAGTIIEFQPERAVQRFRDKNSSQDSISSAKETYQKATQAFGSFISSFTKK
ncbi:MAG: AP-1 complex subunit sigma-3, partial [Paramarteilia canceri]